MWGTPPRVPPPNFNYNYQGNQALSASQGKQKTPAPSKSSALPESKKRKVAEVPSGSQPKAGSAAATSQSIKGWQAKPSNADCAIAGCQESRVFCQAYLKGSSLPSRYG